MKISNFIKPFDKVKSGIFMSRLQKYEQDDNEVTK
jgi:hypothetical protein